MIFALPLQVELRALLRRCQGLAAGANVAELPPPLDALPTILQVLTISLRAVTGADYVPESCGRCWSYPCEVW